jgi:hypothetical protein
VLDFTVTTCNKRVAYNPDMLPSAITGVGPQYISKVSHLNLVNLLQILTLFTTNKNPFVP